MSPLWILLTLLPILGGAERFNCRGRILGAYYADTKSGCKAFHVCVRVAGGGIRDFRFFCAPGTLFHQEAQTCTDWGDDDPLACPADIYDGQFDLYKIGSGFDTKKLSQANREEETEYGLQRAETGDRRLSQNNGGSNGVASDLRAAHSSDFFSGQRERGRDDSVPSVPQVQQPISPLASQSRQSFRRPTTARSTSPPTSYTTYNPPSSPSTPSLSKVNRYDQIPKRKVGRKRPTYTITQTPPTSSSNIFVTQTYSEQPKFFNRRIPSQNTQITASVIPPAYKDEYVEVSRVTPKTNKYFPNSPSPTPFLEPSIEQTKNNGNVNSNNYDVQSSSGFNGQNENRPIKLRNSFSVVSDDEKENEFLRSQVFNGNSERVNSNRVDVSTTTRSFITTTQSYKNANSLSFDQDKNNYNQFPSSKQNYFKSPTTTAFPVTTTYSTTVRYEPAQNLNTIAYNTNNAFNAQSSNFADSSEDDGQYRPPEGEDDGQYRPELYERELLSGAHSLNIAASGNRLFEDHKRQNKNVDKQIYEKPIGKTSSPRPFRPAPTTAAPTHSLHTTEVTYPTTTRAVSENTQRTFDFYQTYTTTSRPYEASGPVNNNGAYETVSTSKPPPRTHEPQRKQNRETVPPVIPSPAVPKLTNHRPQHFAKNTNNKEDTSYDYAYYDSDPSFSEYDHIKEFGKTNIKV